ncbi:zinc finger protein draculin [Drosophila grimshawi]|uniref:GH15098 n=1 Tax=Drosophila grimshawi TaxID=7222 RepID=B4IYU9_DROGR|nr:zinc finger protein draculin [Drosophila grimshawi]XP_032596695.1 zinc finger protein draculin [Drosophila grimshawi]XP_032596698.1 zinc finger protein draculin [Drosophila grimshawi]EDV96636.1 GH15098 [Drosophila grimshawi]EDW04572.1 GH25214 [Drosophila grimshawi]
MVRSRRSLSKEDVASVLTDSGISLSSPPATRELSPQATGSIKRRKRSVNSVQDLFAANGEPDAQPDFSDGDTDADADYVQPVAKRARKADTGKRKQHVCSHCSKEFGGRTDLLRHMLIHSDLRPHKCSECGKCYRQAVNLKNHITTAHERKKQFACTECPKSFALKERLKLHMRLHSGEKPYPCSLCEKRFARGGQLQQHVVSHHKTSIQQFNCTHCSASFSTNANLRVHMERHEQGMEYRCFICENEFPNELALRTHINQEHHKLRQFDCQICQKTIETDEDLASHLKKHSSVKAHVCEVCNSYFTQKSQYNVHMRMHTGERPYQCRICQQTFAHSSVLKLHIRKHTGEKPFRCQLCTDEVAFSQLAHLKNHMKKIHKQQKPYMCPSCHEFFKIKVELQAHAVRSTKCQSTEELNDGDQTADMQTLSSIRFNMAVVLKKISSAQKLRQLGYEKRLIDNVIIASLKLAQRPCHDDATLTPLARLRLNVEEFLKWIVPAQTMQKFREELLSIDTILDKIATNYMNQK